MSRDNEIRAEITVSGRVQGVGFRMFVVREAERLGVVGSVSNQRDGTVTVDATGAPEEISALRTICGAGPGSARVDRVDYAELPVLADRPERFRVVYT